MEVPPCLQPLKVPFEIPAGPDRRIPRFAYCFLFYGPKSIWLVDTGVAGAERLVLEAIRQAGRRPEELEFLILTHSHPDHIGAARAIQKATGCRVAAHAAERAWIEDTRLQEQERPVPGFPLLVGGPVEVDRLLAEGDRLTLGPGLDLQVLHTPGHSRGSLSLWLAGNRTLVSADAIPLPGDLPIYEDAVACVRSITRLQALDEAEVLLSSWDEPRTGREEVRQRMREGLGYLERIHRTVFEVAGQDRVMDMEACRKVVRKLGLPEIAANPLVTTSFRSHLEAGDSLFL